MNSVAAPFANPCAICLNTTYPDDNSAIPFHDDANGRRHLMHRICVEVSRKYMERCPVCRFSPDSISLSTENKVEPEVKVASVAQQILPINLRSELNHAVSWGGDRLVRCLADNHFSPELLLSVFVSFRRDYNFFHQFKLLPLVKAFPPELRWLQLDFIGKYFKKEDLSMLDDLTFTSNHLSELIGHIHKRISRDLIQPILNHDKCTEQVCIDVLRHIVSDHEEELFSLHSRLERLSDIQTATPLWEGLIRRLSPENLSALYNDLGSGLLAQEIKSLIQKTQATSQP